MYAKRIVLIIVILAVIGGLGYLLFRSISHTKSEMPIVMLAFLQPVNETSQLNELSSNIEKAIGKVDDDIEFQYYLADTKGWSQSILIEKPKGITNPREFQKKLSSTIDSIMQEVKSKEFELDVGHTNNILEAFFQKISQNKNDKRLNIYMLAGLFPCSYSAHSCMEAIDKINTVIPDSVYKESQNQKLIWSVCSNNDQPENELLTYLQHNYNAVNNQITITEKEECDKDSVRINITLFSPLNSDKALNIAHYLDSAVNARYLTVEYLTPDDNSMSISYDMSDSVKFQNSFTNFLSSQSKASYKKSYYMLWNLINEKEKDTSSAMREYYLFGFHNKMKGNWKNLKKLKDMKNIKFVLSEETGNEVQKSFIDFFNYYNIPYSIIH
ncbi:MAG: hypothetical protein ACLFQX_01290 [Candidatus Kapaibacterium sp.]